jgi:3-hydroxyisobutyrate dehydrogenase-like beta-hydroxyacid dehydrogenase
LAYDVLTNSLFDSRGHNYKTYGGKIVDERYTPGFAVPLATKDLRLTLAAAEKNQVPMPATSLVHVTLSNWLPAGGPSWTGRLSVCSRPSMPA